MFKSISHWRAFFTIALPILVQGVSISDIQGSTNLSPYVNQTVSVTGVVTAKSSSGFWLAGERSNDTRVSNGVYVFSSSTTILGNVSVGDALSLTAKVTEYRSSSRPDDLSLTELASPSNITKLSINNTVTPLVLGKERSPPTSKLSALDLGQDGFMSVPNAVSRIETVNATLEPELYGLDFWESLEGQLVAVPSPVALNFGNSYGEFWVRGAWPVTGQNGRGGLTITFGSDGIPDANPESILVGSPLDGTKNPVVAVGVTLEDIVGVVTYQFGFYYILPLTAPTVLTRPSTYVPPTTLTSDGESCVLTFGDYNVENLAPTSDHLPAVATHIGTFLKTPDLIFLQEIQDDSGPTDDGTVSANLTLTTLASTIAELTGVKYSFVEISPENNQDGGQPGGNIRTAYFYRSERISLATGSSAGGSTDAVAVTKGSNGEASFTLNPGRVDPTNSAWIDSRKPLAVQWKTASGAYLYTVNVHHASKGGSGSTQGNPRPPINGGVQQRTQQVASVAGFVQSILDIDEDANIIVSGDHNEFLQARSVYSSIQKILTDIDEAAGIDPVERYTYVYDQNTEQLDHIFVSPAITQRLVEAEHIHVNNWSPNYDSRVSDHDPSVGRVRVC